MENKNLIIVSVLVLVVILAAGGFVYMNRPQNTENVDQTQTTETPQLTPTTVSETPAGQTSSPNEVEVITIEGGSYYYKPNEIRVKKGQKVKLTLKSVDMMHDLNIDELNVHVPITKSGSEATVEFTVDKVGKFEFYCSVSNHKKLGQVGTLIVE